MILYGTKLTLVNTDSLQVDTAIDSALSLGIPSAQWMQITVVGFHLLALTGHDLRSAALSQFEKTVFVMKPSKPITKCRM